MSNLNCSFEHKLRRASERNTAKLLIDVFKAAAQFVSAARKNADRTVHVFSNSENKRTGDHAGATGEGFIFHPAFVRADSDLIGSALLNEVHVCALWRKHFVMTNG